MKKVSFGMYWQSYGRQTVELPDSVDATDRMAVLDYIKSIWDRIPLPTDSYTTLSSFVMDSDVLDEESPIEIASED